MRTTLLVASALFSLLLLATVAQLPAYQAYRWFGINEHLRLSGLSGTVWQGQAAKLSVGGYPLGALKWRLHPAELLVLRLTVDLEVNGSDGSASALVTRPISGVTTELSGLGITLPASWLQLVLQEPFFQFQGRIEMQFQKLNLAEDGSINVLLGRMHWRQAAVAGNIVTALGDLTIDWHGEAGVLVGEMSDNGGPLDLAGSVTVADGRYQVAARLAARTDNQPLRQALNVLGRPDRDGSLALNIEGPMIPLGDLLQ